MTNQLQFRGLREGFVFAGRHVYRYFQMPKDRLYLSTSDDLPVHLRTSGLRGHAHAFMLHADRTLVQTHSHVLAAVCACVRACMHEQKRYQGDFAFRSRCSVMMLHN